VEDLLPHPIPKKPHPSELNDFRPVALTSHISQTMERLLLRSLRPQVRHALDPLQFASQEQVGVEDAIVYLLHRAHSHLDKGRGAVRIMFFDFSSAFNTIRLSDKLVQMGVNAHLVSWITDYLTETSVCQAEGCVSETVGQPGAAQGTLTCPVHPVQTSPTTRSRATSTSCLMTLLLWDVSGMDRRVRTGAWWTPLCSGVGITTCS